MDFTTKPTQKTREGRCMHELHKNFPYGLHDKLGDEFKINNMRINVANEFTSFPKKTVMLFGGKTTKVLPFFQRKNLLTI